MFLAAADQQQTSNAHATQRDGRGFRNQSKGLQVSHEELRWCIVSRGNHPRVGRDGKQIDQEDRFLVNESVI